MNDKIKAVIFDLDGTLADTLDDITCALNVMLGACGYPLVTREDAHRSINNGARNLVYHCLPSGLSDEEVDRCLEIYSAAYTDKYLVHTKLYDGIAELCLSLRESGIALAVLSNKQDRLVKTLIDALLPNTFTAAVGQGPYPRKPDPTGPLNIAEELLGVKPSETVFCGDSDVDIHTGLNAGMLPIGVAWGYRPAELLKSVGAAYVVDTPHALGELLLSRA